MQLPVGDAGDAGAESQWHDALADVLVLPGSVRTVALPVVELKSGNVVGFELLARFSPPPGSWLAATGPDAWFAAAQRHRCSAELNAVCVRAALRRLHDLPPDRFLAVNVDPDVLADPRVEAAFREAGNLDRVVVELTARAPVIPGASDHLVAAVATMRDRGALLALDNIGSGYANLQSLLVLRPDMVKLDRGLVGGCSEDPVRRAMMAMLVDFSAGINAWVVAEGVETAVDLQAVASVGVPLAQGWALAKPTPGWPARLRSMPYGPLR